MQAKTLEDIQNLIDNKIPESIYLDYKSGDDLLPKPKKDYTLDLEKNVSAFANADGGWLIYGVKEIETLHGRVPDIIDGVDASVDKEKLDSLIDAIKPSVNIGQFHKIPIAGGRNVFSIYVERGELHQSKDFRFWKRLHTAISEMEIYEIRESLNRNRFAKVSASVKVNYRNLVNNNLLISSVILENNSIIAAEYVRIKVVTNLLVSGSSGWVKYNKTEKIREFYCNAYFFNYMAGPTVQDSHGQVRLPIFRGDTVLLPEISGNYDPTLYPDEEGRKLIFKITVMGNGFTTESEWIWSNDEIKKL